ncbi:MAG: hypothetical protein R6U11_01740 [Bacteroidales bacterium]
MSKKGQVGKMMGFLVYLIAVLGVGIPVSQDIIAESNLTGISATVVGFVPVFLALGGLVAAAATSGLGSK